MRTASCDLMTEYGEFRLHGFADPHSGQEHAALVLGDVSGSIPVLTRVHSECLTGDTLGSLHCDCGAQFKSAMNAIAAEGRGALLYLRQEGRGIGLVNKIRAYALQRAGADTVDANHLLGFPDDLRDYGIAARMLAHLGVSSVRLMTNNPAKLASLKTLGVSIAERIPLVSQPGVHNRSYLMTKSKRMGHLLSTTPQTAAPSSVQFRTSIDHQL